MSEYPAVSRKSENESQAVPSSPPAEPRDDATRDEEHVGYWGPDDRFLPLSALPVGADAQIYFLEQTRPVFAIRWTAVPSSPPAEPRNPNDPKTP